MARTSRALPLGIVAGVAALGLAACGGGNISSSTGSATSGGTAQAKCGDLRIAINPWVGYEANAHVIGYVAKSKLGCNVTYPQLKEEVAWQGMASGSVDTVVENWGHADLTKKYITDAKTVQDAGMTGNEGIIGWYVPEWLATEHPDILDWNNLNKYAANFKTSESGGKGQLLDGDPSYVTNDEALVTNLKLDFKVVFGGSENAIIAAQRDAQKNKKWLITYFYEPQWLFNELKMKQVKLPPYTDGCDADPKTVACDYPPYHLNKLISTKFVESGSPAVGLVKNFTWTNDDQNAVAAMIANEKMDPEAAAQKWVDANADKVAAWLK